MAGRRVLCGLVSLSQARRLRPGDQPTDPETLPHSPSSIDSTTARQSHSFGRQAERIQASPDPQEHPGAPVPTTRFPRLNVGPIITILRGDATTLVCNLRSDCGCKFRGGSTCGFRDSAGTCVEEQDVPCPVIERKSPDRRFTERGSRDVWTVGEGENDPVDRGCHSRALRCLASPASGGESPSENEVVKPWPGGTPGARGTDPEKDVDLDRLAAQTGVATGSAVVVCPGGGYAMLAVDHEGKQVAEWLNSLGVAAFVLKYRLEPRYHHPSILEDAGRAIRTVRSGGKKWEL